MYWLGYYCSMYLMVAGIRIAALWDMKAREWLRGRKSWKSDLQANSPKRNIRIWFHVSSLGEFEQARPVIEKLKGRCPDAHIILTFFSPSGYVQRASYPYASVYYLPADLPGNAKTWIRMIEPDLAVFVKYDLWPGYLNALQKAKIPTILISAHWSLKGYFHSWSVPPSKALLQKLDKIFFQKSELIAAFKSRGFRNIVVAGDTRIDRCLKIPAESQARIPSQLQKAGPFDLVAGSTWPRDEEIVDQVAQQFGLKVLLAPHDVSQANIARLLAFFGDRARLLSKWNGELPSSGILIVDSIGMLSALYTLGPVAYVGGGFGKGIHNILEPMAHARPVIFGPRYQAFAEAVDMIAQKGARVVQDATSLAESIRFFQSPGAAKTAGQTGYRYLQTHSGASEIVTAYILKTIPCSPE